MLNKLEICELRIAVLFQIFALDFLRKHQIIIFWKYIVYNVWSRWEMKKISLYTNQRWKETIDCIPITYTEKHLMLTWKNFDNICKFYNIMVVNTTYSNFYYKNCFTVLKIINLFVKNIFLTKKIFIVTSKY